MKQTFTKNEIITTENGVIVFVQTRAEILAELNAYTMSNNYKFAKIFEDKLDKMNAAQN